MTQAPRDPDGERLSLLSCLNPLLQGLSSGLPRRGRSLLEIGCGDGRVLDVLWTLGFDINGLEHDPGKADEARALLGGRADIRVGAYDPVPYEDDSFDYVILVRVFEGHPEVDALLDEAVRVAARNIVLVFPNAWSLAWIATRLPRRARGDCPRMYNPLTMLRALRRHCPGRGFGLRSILPGPPSTWWARRPLWRRVNRSLMPLPCGAFVGIRLDLAPPAPATGLPVRVSPSRLTAPDASAVISYSEGRPHRQSGKTIPCSRHDL